MRTLLFELRPESIDKTELQELLRQLIAAAKSRKRIKAQLSARGDAVRLPPTVHVALYRITQESINNILKHSQASEFTVTLEQEPQRIELTIVDNGSGFDTSETHSGLGLSSMRERAEGIGAILTVTSAPGQGTQINIVWDAVGDPAWEDEEPIAKKE
jgi:signal transduction histidine kinase